MSVYTKGMLASWIIWMPISCTVALLLPKLSTLQLVGWALLNVIVSAVLCFLLIEFFKRRQQ